MRDELRRMALIGTGVAELTRHRAERLVKDLVKSGDIRREQASSLVTELLERSRETRGELAGFVRAEIRNQVEALGLASARDVERLARRVARLEARVREGAAPAAASSATTPPKGARKTARAKKPVAKKTTAKKAPGGAGAPGA